MASLKKIATTAEELVALSADATVRNIVIRGALSNLPSFRLAPGQTLAAEGEEAVLSFAPGSDGLQLSTDNEVVGIRIETSVDRRAIFNDTSVGTLGRMRLAGLSTIGQVQLLARDKVLSGHVDVDGLDVIAADVRAQPDRPHGYGVFVTQGAFTLWNMQADPKVIISAQLKGLSAGRPTAPVLGSGIFVSGMLDGGRLSAPLLETGARSTATAKSHQARPITSPAASLRYPTPSLTSSVISDRSSRMA